MSPTSHDFDERFYVGIDVQMQRPCALVALDQHLRMVESSWLEGTSSVGISDMVCRKLDRLGPPEGIIIGIDAPRQPLDRKRPFYWDGTKDGWRARRPSERGWGRHCEVVVASSGLGRPQWTPILSESPEWMVLGFGLFRELTSRGYAVHEVFPSAAYNLLQAEDHSKVTIDFSAFADGPKDLIDACVAAFTVHEFEAGRGAAVGDDELGQIILPRPLPAHVPASLLNWPSPKQVGAQGTSPLKKTTS